MSVCHSVIQKEMSLTDGLKVEKWARKTMTLRSRINTETPNALYTFLLPPFPMLDRGWVYPYPYPYP